MTSISDGEVFDDVFVSMRKRDEILSCDPYYLHLIHRQPNVGAFLRGCGPYVWLHHLQESTLDNTLWLDLRIVGTVHSEGLLSLYYQPRRELEIPHWLPSQLIDKFSLVQVGWTYMRDHFLSMPKEGAHAEGLRVRLYMFEQLSAELDSKTKEVQHED